MSDQRKRTVVMTSLGTFHHPDCPRLKRLKRPTSTHEIHPQYNRDSYGGWWLDGGPAWFADCCEKRFRTRRVEMEVWEEVEVWETDDE